MANSISSWDKRIEERKDLLTASKWQYSSTRNLYTHIQSKCRSNFFTLPNFASQQCIFRSRPHSLLLHSLTLLLRPLLLQEFLLLLRLHRRQFPFSLLLLHAITHILALLGLLIVVDLLQPSGLLFAGRAHFAHGFGTEMRGADEGVGEAEECVEEGGG